jgi:hypothetical protein
MRRSAPLALALSLAAATPAAASDWDGASFAGQRPLSAPALERIAVDFWAQRNIRVCDPTIMRAPRLLASDGVQASGRAWAPSCTVWVQDLWATSAHRDVREELCTLVVHETGHLAGLEHTDSGSWPRALTRRRGRASAGLAGPLRLPVVPVLPKEGTDVSFGLGVAEAALPGLAHLLGGYRPLLLALPGHYATTRSLTTPLVAVSSSLVTFVAPP